MTMRESLVERYTQVRRTTLALAAPLAAEDTVVQSMPDGSPTKWHLAHTTWFFEEFALAKRLPDYRPVDDRYAYLFNSYYEAVGPRQPRTARGLLSRPRLDEVLAYRAAVDARMTELILNAREDLLRDLTVTTTLGLNHEQQHQELILTDAHHVLFCNPLRPAYRERALPRGVAAPLRWIRHGGGLHTIGHEGEGFAFDNEGPRHRAFLEAFEIASRPVTAGEFMAFIEDGGYRRSELWLSEGWALSQAEGWRAPLYWEERDRKWREFTLAGTVPLDPEAPVSHVSYFEADAYARWAEARLPNEGEWEVFAARTETEGNLLESGLLAPTASPAPSGDAPVDAPEQLFGDVWEWTGSPYVAYPRYCAPAGALGEYNGKFMCNQMVLRGGSCFTPRSHIRATYRNFFPPGTRWQMAGMRLARWA